MSPTADGQHVIACTFQRYSLESTRDHALRISVGHRLAARSTWSRSPVASDPEVSLDATGPTYLSRSEYRAFRCAAEYPEEFGGQASGTSPGT
jgi:hypothetical protein